MKTQTILANLLQSDWGPTMRAIAWAVGHAVIIPVAVAIVVAEWLALTWRRPLAGVLALVPVRRPDPIDAINQGMAALVIDVEIRTWVTHFAQSESPAPMSPALASGLRRKRPQGFA